MLCNTLLLRPQILSKRDTTRHNELLKKNEKKSTRRRKRERGRMQVHKHRVNEEDEERGEGNTLPERQTMEE